MANIAAAGSASSALTPVLNPHKTIRILLCDDHDVVRRGLRSIIEARPPWIVVGDACNGREGVEMARAAKPDIVIMDVSMPELNGLEAARRIRAAAPDTRILIVTLHESEHVLDEALRAGALGYLLKSDVSKELIHAIEALLRGQPYFTAKIGQAILQGYLRSKSGAAGELLSSREREVLQALAEGRTTKDVARMLGVSVKTAETHRTNLMRKTGVHTIAELVRYAVRNKFIEA